jgi:hypothetical protein
VRFSSKDACITWGGRVQLGDKRLVASAGQLAEQIHPDLQ